MAAILERRKRAAVCLRDIRTGKLVGTDLTKRFADGPVTRVAFSPDGAQIAMVTSGRGLTIHSVPALAEIDQLTTDRPDYVEYSDDGRLLLYVTSTRSARVSAVFIQPAAGGAVVSLGEHKGGVAFAHFSEGGAHIVTAGEDGFVRVWSSAGVLIAQLQGVENLRAGGALLRGGKGLVLAASDETVQIWNLDAGAQDDIIATLIAALDGAGPLTPQEQEDWLFSEAPADLRAALVACALDRA